MKKNKHVIFVIIIIVFLLSNSITAVGLSIEEVQEQIDLNSLLDALPDSTKEYLPQDLRTSGNLINQIQNTDSNYFFEIIGNIINKLLPSTTKKLTSLLGIIITFSIINTLKDNIGTPNYSKCLSLLTITILSIFIYEFANKIWKETEAYISYIDALITALIPIMTFLYTLGGNVSTAIVNSSSLAILLTFSNKFVYSCILPLSKICFGLTIAGNIGNIKGVSKISKTLKSVFTLIFSTLITVFSIFLFFKTNLSASADSAATRTIKFAGSFIPVIGSALGESVRSLMSGISLIKSSVGFFGIILIVVITLPIFIKILSTKICIDIAAFTASLLGCEKESVFLKETSGVINFLIAINFSTSLMFIFELIIFVTISPALGTT